MERLAMNWQRATRSLLCGALLSVAPVAAAWAEDTFDIPAGARFSQAKLARIDEFFRNEVEHSRIPGAVILIQHHGQPIYARAFGMRDLGSSLPMTSDTIFRLHSMSKPITSVAAMMLVDQGRLKLDDPVSKYIPSFADAKVGVEKTVEEGAKALAIEPLVRPITVRDLLLHTSGITYGFYGQGMVRRVYGNANIYDGDFDNAEFAERIADLPLQEQPGTLWDYGHSTDVLGRVIEVVSGKSLLKFEQDALLGPLGMTDTGFFIADRAKRFMMAQPMPWDVDFHVGFDSGPDRFMKWESGGGGMHSTVGDFARFAQMVVNGGTLDGRRYLSPQAFKEMTTDHIGKDSGVKRDVLYFPGDGFGFGLGFGVRTDPGNAKPPPPGSLGELKWDGASGCYFVIDPKQDFFFVLLQQAPSERQRIQRAVKQMIYEALEK
jgi:CubicO group peptidase (beta-lactamase class C family)